MTSASHTNRYGYAYWIDYRFPTETDGARRWIDTYDTFQADLDDLRRTGCRIVAFGYHTVPPPLSSRPEERYAT